MDPRVTFIIAHHNYHKYLPSAIDSALKQTYKNIHICIIDDCSKNQESVFEIIENFAFFTNFYEKDNKTIYESDKITYIKLSKQNGSYKQAYARNCGIEQCWNNTDYFAILDADDENYPTKIEKCIKILEENKENFCAVYTDTDIINVQNNRIVREYREPFDRIKLLQECIVHSGCVINKNCLQEVLENGKVFDEEMPPCEDYDLWIRLSEKYLFYHIPESLNLVRVHPQNSTNTSTHEHRMSRLQRIHEKRKNRCKAT